MLTIGEFSQLTRVPAKTLRYYDDIGLFHPAQVDQWTNYRYYSIEQLPRLYRILALKALDLTLEQIMNLLHDDLSPEQIRGMLRLKQVELNRKVQDTQQRLAYVDNLIHQLEKEGKMSDYDVILKDVPQIKVAITQGVAPEMKHIGYTLTTMFRDVIEHLRQHNVSYSDQGITLYLDDEMRETDVSIAAAFPVASDFPSSDAVTLEQLPAHAMASTIHRGSFARLENAYGAILEWIATSGYQVAGSPREISLKYDPQGDPADYVTEVQFPVKQRDHDAEANI